MSRFEEQLPGDNGKSCVHIRFNNSSRSENKIKQLPFFVCRTFDKHFGFISVSTSYLDPKIQYHENRTFLFCLSIYSGADAAG